MRTARTMSPTCLRWSVPITPRSHLKHNGTYKHWNIQPITYKNHLTKLWQASAAADAAHGGWHDDPRDAAAKGASLPATVFNLVNVIMGAGYVSIPFACKQGGWAALAVLWVLAAVFCYTGHALLQCCKLVDQQIALETSSTSSTLKQHTSPGQHLQLKATGASSPAGYEAVAGRAFGPLGLAVVSGVMYAELLGICCVYVVLEAEILSTLLSSTAFGHRLTQLFGSSAFGLLASAVMVPTVLLPDLGSLSILGALGVAAAASVALALAGLFISSGPAALSALADTAVLRLQTLPQVLGILAFVYAGHSTFPVIQQSMAEPAKAPRAVSCGYAITALICTVLGAFGYALYGPQTMPVVTANLPSMSVIALLCTSLTLCNPFSAFALTLEPVAVAVQQKLVKTARGSNNTATQPPYALRAATRLGLALACCAAALVMPYVAEVMALVGALLTMSISLIIPALMHVALIGRDLPWWLLVLDGCVLMIGVTCAVVGATSAMQCLQEKLAMSPVM